MNTDDFEARKGFAGEKRVSMKRRKVGQDYHSRQFYMITLAVEGRKPLLGSLAGEGDQATIELSPLGEAVVAQWLGIPMYYPEATMVAHQVMPDHFHGIIYISDKTAAHLGQIVKGFKIGCNRELRGRLLAAMESLHTREAAGTAGQTGATGQAGADGAVGQAGAEEERGELQRRGLFVQRLLSYAAFLTQPLHSVPPEKATLWEKGYNDKILFNYTTLSKWKAYLEDNPRRLAIRRAHPDFFRVRFGVEVAGRKYAAIGNRFLLFRASSILVFGNCFCFFRRSAPGSLFS